MNSSYFYINFKTNNIARTLDFLISKNVDIAIDILSSKLKVDRQILIEKFIEYDFSGTEYFDSLLKEIADVSIKDINEINWWRLCDAYDLMGEKYPRN